MEHNVEIMEGEEPNPFFGDWRDLGDIKSGSVIRSIGTTATVFGSVMLTLVFAIIFLISSTLNTLFLVIFMRKPSLRNISNRFIVSLTVSNLVSAWIFLPIIIADIFLKDIGSPDGGLTFSVFSTAYFYCTTFTVIADFSTSASVFGTMLIAFDRFFAITDPLHYHMLVTRCRSWIFIALGWIIAVFIAVFSGLIGDNGGRWNVCHVEAAPSEDFYYWSHLAFSVVSFLLCFALPLLMISWAYAKIYGAAQQNSERARRSSLCNPSLEVIDHAKSISRNSSTKSTSSQIVSTIRRRISNASLFLYKEEARAAKISIGVIVLFIVCWLPYYIFNIFYVTFPQGDIPAYLFKVIYVFALMNSAISPYVYMYRSKRIQREVLRLFGITTKFKRREFERRRPNYHQLPPNLENIPSCPISLDGHFKLELQSSSETSSNAHKHVLAKILKNKYILRPKSWRDSMNLSTSSVSTTPSTDSTSSSSFSKGSCTTTANICCSTQTLTNIIASEKPDSYHLRNI